MSIYRSIANKFENLDKDGNADYQYCTEKDIKIHVIFFPKMHNLNPIVKKPTAIGKHIK